MALSQKYLERVRRLSQGKDKPKTVNRQQIARLDAAIKQQRIEREKGGWRGAAKWLEKKFPEDFGEAKAARAEQAPVIETRSSGICQNSELVMESQGSPNASESPQSAPETPPALALPLLPASWWQALLYGSREAMLLPRDANTALGLAARKLGKDSDVVQFSDGVRVNTLRKMLDEGAKVWEVMNKLWRVAPASPGAPAPNEDQSHCSPGVRDCPRSMPAWQANLVPSEPKA
jgi:hypothetical protein